MFLVLSAFSPNTCADIKKIYKINNCCERGTNVINRTSCSDVINLYVTFTLNDEKTFYERFDTLIESVKQEPGTLQYEYFFNGTSVTILERFADMSALAIHSSNPVVNELSSTVSDFKVTLLTQAQGFGPCPI